MSITHRPIDFTDKYCIEDDQEIEQINLDEQEEEEPELVPPLFDPEAFTKDNEPLLLEQYKLKHEELEIYAKETSLIRQSFKEKALKLEKEEFQKLKGYEEGQEEWDGRLHRKYTRRRQGQKLEVVDEAQDERPAGFKYRKRKRNELSYHDKVNVVHDIIVGLKSNKEVARSY